MRPRAASSHHSFGAWRLPLAHILAGNRYPLSGICARSCSEANLQPALERDARRRKNDRRRLTGLALAFSVHVADVVLIEQVVDSEACEHVRRRLIADIEIDQIVGTDWGEIRKPVLVAIRDLAGSLRRHGLPAH